MVSPSVWGEAFVLLVEFSDVCASEDWGAHGAQEWHLLPLLHDGEGQGLDELPLVVCMIGRSIGRGSSAGGGSGLA